MRNTTKGALAAGAAAVLLLGGAGSLAYWQTEASGTADDISSGRLALIDPDPGQWALNGSPVVDPAAVRVSPGDHLAWSGSFEIDAVGDTLRGDVTVDGGAEGGTLAPYVDTTVVDYTVGGERATSISSADDGKRLVVNIEVDFPFGETVDNASQDKVLDVSDVSVAVTQTDATLP